MAFQNSSGVYIYKALCSVWMSQMRKCTAKQSIRGRLLVAKLSYLMDIWIIITFLLAIRENLSQRQTLARLWDMLSYESVTVMRDNFCKSRHTFIIRTESLPWGRYGHHLENDSKWKYQPTSGFYVAIIVDVGECMCVWSGWYNPLEGVSRVIPGVMGCCSFSTPPLWGTEEC